MSDYESIPHHERRFAAIDRDVAAVKTDVGVLQADVRTLASGQIALQSSQDRGFTELKSVMEAKNNEQPRISIAMLIAFVTMIFTIIVVGVGTFWAATLLLTNPIQQSLDEEREYTGDHGAQLKLLEERTNLNRLYSETLARLSDENSVARHTEQQNQIDKTHAEMVLQRAEHLKLAEDRGKREGIEEIRRIEEARSLRFQEADHPALVIPPTSP